MSEHVKPALHFVGFRGDEYTTAVRLFGKPDFIHRVWDIRAKSGGDTHPSDTFVFAKGDERSPVVDFVFDDSGVAPHAFDKAQRPIKRRK